VYSKPKPLSFRRSFFLPVPPIGPKLQPILRMRDSGFASDVYLNGYENPVVLCRILGFHGDDYEERRLVGCGAVWILQKPTFWRNVSPQSSELKKHTRARKNVKTFANRLVSHYRSVFCAFIFAPVPEPQLVEWPKHRCFN
jgi:hypothetical protein